MIRQLQPGNPASPASTDQIITDADDAIREVFESLNAIESEFRSGLDRGAMQALREPFLLPESKRRLRVIHAGLLSLMQEVQRLVNLVLNLTRLAEFWPTDPALQSVCAEWCYLIECKLQSHRPLRPLCDHVVRAGAATFTEPVGKGPEVKMYRLYHRGIKYCVIMREAALEKLNALRPRGDSDTALTNIGRVRLHSAEEEPLG